MANKIITIEEAFKSIIETGSPGNISQKRQVYNDLLKMGFKATDSVSTLVTEKNTKRLLDKNFVTYKYQHIRQLITAGGVGSENNPFLGKDAATQRIRKETGIKSVSDPGKKMSHTPNTRGYLQSINAAVIELTKRGDPRSLSLKNYIIMMTTAGLRNEHLVQGVTRHNLSEEGIFRNIITKGTGAGKKVHQNYEVGEAHSKVLNQQRDLARQQGWQNKLWHTDVGSMKRQVVAFLKPIFKKNNVNWIDNRTGNAKSFTMGDLRNQTSRIFLTFHDSNRLTRFMSHAMKGIGEKFYAGTGLGRSELATLGRRVTKAATTLGDDLDNMYKLVFGDLLGHNITDNAKKHGINLSGTAISKTVRVPEKALKGHVDNLTGKNVILDIELEKLEEDVDKKIKNIEKKEEALQKRKGTIPLKDDQKTSSGLQRLKNIFGKGVLKALPLLPIVEPFRYSRTAKQRTGEVLAKHAQFASEVPPDYYTDDRARQMQTDEFWKATLESYGGAEPESIDQKALQLKKEEGSYLSPEEETLLLDMQGIPYT